MSPPNSLARLLARRAQALKRHFTAALEGSDVAVHQTRVASRRLREAVPPLIEGLKHARGRYVCRKLRVVTRTLGTIRELDVALHLIDDLHDRADVPRAALAETRAHVLEDRERRCQVMTARLKKIDIEKLYGRLESVRRALLASASDRTWRVALAARLVSRARRLDHAVADAGQIYSIDALHRVRIAAKKLRYAVEIASGSGTPASPVLKALKRTQDALGRLHDLQRLQSDVAALAASPRVHRAGIDTGRTLLARMIEDDCRRLHGRYVALLPALHDAITAARSDIATGVTGPRSRRLVKMSLPAYRSTRGVR